MTLVWYANVSCSLIWIIRLVSRRKSPRQLAITQIHTHRKNRHGSWRDGKGGALDASRPLDPEVDAGADVAAPTESSKSDAKTSRSHLRCCVTVHIARGRQPHQRQRAQWEATPSPSLRLKTAHAPGASLAYCASHLHPRIAPIAYTKSIAAEAAEARASAYQQHIRPDAG